MLDELSCVIDELQFVYLLTFYLLYNMMYNLPTNEMVL